MKLTVALSVLLLALLSAACSPGTYRVDATCTLSGDGVYDVTWTEGTADVDYVAVCATVAPTATAIPPTPGPVLARWDFDANNAWAGFKTAPGGDQFTWSYPMVAASGGIGSISFTDDWKIKADGNHCCSANGYGRISIAAWVHVNGMEGGPALNLPTLIGRTVSGRLRAVGPNGEPGLLNVGDGHMAQMGIWFQLGNADLTRASNWFAPFDQQVLSDQWNDISLAITEANTVCLGWRKDGYIYDCETEGRTVKNFGYTFTPVDSGLWNPDYDPALDNLPTGTFYMDWVELR